MDWKDEYPENRKPAYAELLGFFEPRIRALFEEFDRAVNDRFKVHNKYHRYSGANGWTYGFGRSYSCELFSVTVGRGYFKTLGVTVSDDNSLLEALAKAQEKYDEGFEERYAELCEERRRRQSARAKERLALEKAEMREIAAKTDSEKFNKFRWCKKVSRGDLLRLYQSDAKGMLDEELLEEVGLTIYTRCKQSKAARDCMAKGQIICHHCSAVLNTGRVSPSGSVIVKSASDDGVIRCPCGCSYTYREYRRSCNAANMPAGRAEPVFADFMDKWLTCRGARRKMILIDNLIHQFHVTLMSGATGRSVCVNIIEGTLKQISELLNTLAN